MAAFVSAGAIASCSVRVHSSCVRPLAPVTAQRTRRGSRSASTMALRAAENAFTDALSATSGAIQPAMSAGSTDAISTLSHRAAMLALDIGPFTDVDPKTIALGGAILGGFLLASAIIVIISRT
mmetsp:Transcript_6339/g.16916  ORF Transcript_6339/g.16916 Transcript_6339/m.16916 type:complete len:124 (-) Transcript_6339:77-448(-)|eukprot:CAMPEP_0185833784 /NCGR_PEP_ID=MMETSP1353-20130828/3462_1 /TAXON_ID=1077150 /ORGANISM="Erythrolobus australicus, Strain CCMP3124" /LENGTH=123 /DNA_ID=CAMNT_0028532111 /DNA_START=83 /DNA_END=454 /DNA_ORIENTATION=-